MGERWRVEHHAGGAGELHHLEPAPGARRLLVLRPTRPAVVLGSTQQVPGVDERAAALGLEVVRRRSGGGAVVLRPADHVWVDVVVPRDDPRWDDDVERATWWIGEAWARLLVGLGGDEGPEPVVHRRGLADRALGRRACFAAMGPGEVAVGGRKVVGISQRRTRDVARFQCLAYVAWDPGPLLAVLGEAGDGPLSHALVERAGAAERLVGRDPGTVVELLARQLR